MRKLYSANFACVKRIPVLFLLILLSLSVSVASGQSSANYVVTTNNDGTLATDKNGNPISVASATNHISNDFTSTNGSLTAIGFDFYFMGKLYTHFIAGNDGVVGLGISTSGSSILGTSTANDLTRTSFAYPPTTTDNSAVLAGFWDDLRTARTGATVRSVVVGGAPNRCLVIQYNAVINTASTTATDPADGVFQIRIYETTSEIEYVYGKMTIGPSSGTVTASIGFSAGATDNSFLAVSSLSTYAVTTTAASEPATQNLVNSSTAGNIAALHSTADGSRRYFRFTPPLISVPPSGLNFTGVGGSGMTLNWTDGTGESGYTIYRSTDNVTFTPVATVGANTTSYSGLGLNPSTLYYWRVEAFSEGGVVTPLSGSQATGLATLSGTFTVGAGGDYPNLTTAFNDINTQGLSGNIELQLITGYPASPETYPIASSVAPSSGTFNVTIYPTVAGLSITSNNTTGTLNLNNGKNITFDGRVNATGTTKDLVIANTSTTGYAIQLVNDATGNNFRYVSIQGANTGTSSGVIVFGTTNGSSGNDNNTIENSDIRDAGSTPSNGIYSVGTTTAALTNSGNTVSNSNIYNIFNAGGSSNGITIGAGNTDWTINANSFYQTGTRTATAGGTHSAILISNTSGNNFIVTNNIIGGANAAGGGTAWTVAGSFANRFRGISINVGSTTPSSVQGNTIANFNFTSNSSASTVGGPWVGIYVTGGSVNVGTVTGNIIGSATGTGSVSLTNVTNQGGISSGIYVDGSSTTSISNNIIGSVTTGGTVAYGFTGIATTSGTTLTISNNIIGSTTTANSINANTGATGTTAQVVRGILNSSSGTVTISNNTIANLNNNFLPAAASTANHMIGISSTSGTNTITGNTVRNLSSAANGTGSGSTAAMIGISITSTTAGITVSNNTVHSLSQTHATAPVNVAGLYYSGPTTGTNVIGRNFIHSLSLNSSSATATLIGMNVAGGTSTFQNNMIRLGVNAAGASLTNNIIIVGIDKATTSNNNFYHNSVYIGGSGVVASTAHTIAFRRSSTGADIVQNNIFVNQRSNAAGTAKHYAFGLNAATTLTSGFNVYHGTGTGFVFGYIGTPGTTDYATLAMFKGVSGTEAGSAFGNPQFIAPTGTSTTVDLHIHATNPTPIESQGLAISVTDDFDGQSRGGLTPVDIGADAGDFVAADISGPAITFTALGASTCVGNRTLSATITDLSTVETTAGLKPRLYFKRSTDANTFNDNSSGTDGWKYVEASNSTSPFSFTTDVTLLNGGTGLTAGQTLQYFIVAQDMPGNVTIYPGAFAAPPASVALTATAFPVTGPASYVTSAGFNNGAVTIGATGTYTSLTGAGGFFAAVNTAGGLATDVTVTIIDASVTEAGTNALNGMTYGCSGVNTITIKPASGIDALLTGSVNAGAIIKLNGADNVIIDGSNNGTDSRNLTIRNNSTTTSGNAAVWFAAPAAGNGATNNTIKNTIIEGNAASTTFLGMYVGGSTSISLTAGGSEANNNNTIHNNLFRKSQHGLALFGYGATTPDLNNVISDNDFGTAVAGEGFLLEAIHADRQTNLIVSGNDVQNVKGTSGTNMYGIRLLDFKNGKAYNNQVHNIAYTGTSTTKLYGIALVSSTFSTAGNPSGAMVYNNTVYDMTSSGTSSVWTMSGIAASTGYGDKYYFNTVYLTGQLNNGPGYVAAFANGDGTLTTAGAAIDVRNNIFVLAGTSGAGNVWAIHSTATSLTGSTFNNNIIRSAATGTGVINNAVRFNGVNYATLADWQAFAAPNDAASLDSDPLLNSATNLRPQPGSPAVGAGTPIAGITTDQLGAVRSLTAPTIGAFENTVDLVAPVITYSALGGACNTGDRALTVTITDGGGLVTGANGPRIYFRKNSGTWFSAAGTAGAGSTWDFTIASATVGGVAVGDVISYYVIAQDVSGNVGSNPAGAVASDVNTVTTHPASPNTYIVSTTLNGIYTVGSTGMIPTLTQAAALYNAGCALGGPVTFSLIDEDYTTATEIFPINFLTNPNASAVNTLTIKPAAGVTPTIVGNTSPLIKFKGTDFVTIDGSNTSGGATKDLTLQNTSTVSGSSVVWIGSLGAGAGATNITVKNSNIIGGSLGSSSVSTFGIVALDDAGAPNGADNDNLLIQDNSISNVSYGIQTSGTTANSNDNTVISGNTIGSSTAASSIGKAGIVMGNSTNATVWGNTIYNVQTSNSYNVYGIQLTAGTIGTVVNANNIYSVKYTGTSGYGGKGIELNNTGATANITLSNNMISDIGGDSWTVAHADAVIGINLTGTNGMINLYYNSVNMNTGSFAGHATSGTFSAALHVGTSSTVLDIRNNIFSTNLVNTNLASAKTYAIYSSAANTAFANIDYNDYYVSGSQGVLANIGATDRTTLAALATAFTGNANSLNVVPVFVSTTDAHLVADANCGLDGKATPIATVTADFDNESRNATTPDIGADEFTSTFTLIITNPAAVCTGSTVDLTATPVTAGSTTTGTFTYWTDAAGTSALVNPNAVGTGGTYYIKLVKGSCSEILPVTVTVDPASVGGTASADQTICSGTAPADLTLAGNTGSVVKWQRSADLAFTSPVDIASSASTTLASASIGNLTATTYFRAVVKSGVCSEANSSVVTITVDPVSVGGTASANQNVCTGSAPADITLSGNTGNVVKWQRSTVNDFSSGVTDISVTSTTLSGATDIGTLTATTYFRAVVKSGVCTEANSSVVTITVDPASVGGTASANQTICTGSAPSDITLSGNTGGVVKWQSSTDPAFAVATDINVTSTTLTGAAIGNLSQTTYFRAVVKSGACTEANSSSVMVTVDPASVGGTASGNQTICAGSAPSNITVAGTTGNIVRWERSTTSGFTAGTVTNINVTSATLNGTTDIGNLTTTTYVRAIVKSGVCNEAASSVVTITVDPATVGGTVSSDQTICSGSSPANITLSGNTGSVVKWQKISSAPFSTPVDIASTSTTLTSAEMGSLTETTFFRAVVKSGVCNEAFSSAVTITVSTATVAGTVSGAQTVCIGNAPITDLTLSGHTGSVVKWQKSTDAAFTSPVDIASTSATLTSSAIGAVNENTYFRAVVKSGGCPEANSNAVLVGVNTNVSNATALAGVIGGSSVCANYSVSTSNNFLNNCDLIATVVPSGAAPVSGNVNACVKIDGSVQIAPTGEPYVQRHYDIHPATNATTATSTITLYFKQSEFDNFNVNKGFRPALPTGASDAAGIANLRITQYNGTGTAPGNYSGTAVQLNPADANITYNAAAARWSVTFDATGSGGFYVHTGQFVLPVSLLEFKGEQSGSMNRLSWKTATEVNNRGFEVERSADGVNFTALGFVGTKAENGNSSSTIYYGYNDEKPFAGNNYYRLKQIDNNGKVNYSNTILLSRKVVDITLTGLYPNPTQRTLNLVINSPKAEKITLIVTDLHGKVLMQQPAQIMTGENLQKLDVLHLAAGTYFIKAVCSSGCETAVQRFVKQ